MPALLFARFEHVPFISCHDDARSVGRSAHGGAGARLLWEARVPPRRGAGARRLGSSRAGGGRPARGDVVVEIVVARASRAGARCGAAYFFCILAYYD